LKKDPAKQPRLDAVLYVLAESLRCLGIVLAPFIPDAAEKIRAAVGQTAAPTLAEAVWGRLAAGTRVQKIAALFPRVENKKPTAAAAPVCRRGARVRSGEVPKSEARGG